MKLTLLVLLLAACHSARKQDARIATEFKAMWATRGPGLVRTPCDGRDAKRERMDPLLRIAADAQPLWKQYDRPLPDQIAQRLIAWRPPALADAELRCLISDPGAKPGAWAILGTLAALLEHRAELTGEWMSASIALNLYANAPPMQYLYFFGAAFILERATKLAASQPPPPPLVPTLREAAHAATMPQATLCAGEKEELLAHGANTFFGHFPELRAELIARYGSELAPLYDEPHALPSFAAWTAYRAVYDLVDKQCATTPPAELVKRAAPLLAAVKVEDPNLGMLLDVAIGRIDTYTRLRAAEAAFVSALGGP